MSWLFRTFWLCLFCSGGLLLGCEVPRPYDAFTPDAGSTDQDDPDGGGDVVEDDGRIPIFTKPDAGSSKDGGGGVHDAKVEAGPSPGPDDPEPPDDPLVGDYWMRIESKAEATAKQASITISSETLSQTYVLVRIGYDGKVLKFADWQCASKLTQKCTSGCRSMSITYRDPIKSNQAYAPALRTLEVEGGSWTASAVPYAVGWKGDFAERDLPVPTSEGDSLVYDPDGGGKGINISTKVVATSGLSAACELRVVQKILVSYAGKLADGELASGTMTDKGSQQTVLDNSCAGAKADGKAGPPGALRFVRKPIESDDKTWVCPSLADFEAAFQ